MQTTGILGSYAPEYLRIEIAHKESVLARLRGNYEQSERAIRNACGIPAQLETEGSVLHHFYSGIR